MNRSFREVTALWRRGEGSLSHQQRVTRLYRRALRAALDWAVDRPLFYEEAGRIRAEFDAHKALDPHDGKVARLVREAEEKLHDFTHPDEYVAPYMPGGSRFMRNPAPPLGVVFPDGVPPEADVAPMDVNYIQMPKSARPEGYDAVLIDVYKKRAE